MLKPFTLTNVRQTSAGEFRYPWEFTFDPATITENTRRDKKLRQEWIMDTSTKHLFYSGFVGNVESIRVSKQNHATRCVLLSADYDMPLTDDRVQAAIRNMKIKPTFIETSIGGNCRLVWAFEIPFPLSSPSFTNFFLQRAKEWLKLDLLPMLDEPAWIDTARLLCAGDKWTPTGHPPVSTEELQTFFVECAKEYRFKNCDEVVIGLDIVEAELRKKYPAFADWPGSFEVGSQGPSFWVEGSTSKNSAIIKADGIFTFAGHAEKSFYSWGDLLGREFMEDYEKTSIAKATHDIWFDEVKYHRKCGDVYISMKKDELQSYLRVDCRLSNKPDKSGISPLDAAMQHIYNEQRVAGAAPFVPLKQGPHIFMGHRHLNTYRGKPIQPAAGTHKWGPHGDFAFWSALFNGFFDPIDQLQNHIAWGQYYYQGVLENVSRPGQAMYVAGRAGSGKTFISRNCWGLAVGGYADASKFMLNESSFNSHLLSVPHWVMDDDSTGTSDYVANQAHMAVKKLIANDTFEYHKKYEQSCQTGWGGRLYCTLNLCATSGKMLGQMDDSMLAKVMLLRAADPALRPDGFKFPSRAEIERLGREQLPYFLKWLIDYKVPDYIVREPARYGYESRHEESLFERAKATNPVAPFKEKLIEALVGYFEQNPEATEWSGPLTKVVELINNFSTDNTFMRSLKPERLAGFVEELSEEKFMDCYSTIAPKYNVRMWHYRKPTV